jgi:hypothetical protein
VTKRCDLQVAALENHGVACIFEPSISSEIFGVPLARLVRYRNIKRIQRH